MSKERKERRAKTIPDWVSSELIDWLEELYPEPTLNPESSGSEKKVWYMLGQRSVLHTIRAKIEARDAKN
jgi:hypothetical protein